jgi:hypothetical protein
MNFYYTDKAGLVVGPIAREQLQKLVDSGLIGADSQACYEGSEDWQPLATFVRPTEKTEAKPLPVKSSPVQAVVSNPPSPATQQVPEFKLPPIEGSAVADALTCVAVLEFIAAPIAGIGVGSGNTLAGWVIFLSGVISGLILLGFAKVIDHTSQSAQRLLRIERLLQRDHDDKKAA